MALVKTATAQQRSDAQKLIEKQMAENEASRLKPRPKAGATLTIRPSLMPAFEVFRDAAKAGEEIRSTLQRTTAEIRELEAEGVLEVTATRTQGRGEAPTAVRLLTTSVTEDAGKEPRRRTSRGPRLGRPPLAATRMMSPPSMKATPEEMNRLLRALEAEERRVNDTSSADNDRKIAELQKRLATAKGDDLTRVYNEFQMAMEERHSLATRVRGDAFKNIEASSLAERRFLGLLRPDYAD